MTNREVRSHLIQIKLLIDTMENCITQVQNLVYAVEEQIIDEEDKNWVLTSIPKLYKMREYENV